MKIKHSSPSIQVDFKKLKKIIESNNIAENFYCRQLENLISNYVDSKYSIVTSSGTAALHLLLKALNINNKWTVILPSYCCISILNAVNYVGAKYIFCDIDKNTLNIHFRNLKEKLKKINNKKIILIVTNTFGKLENMEELNKLNIPYIMDLAQGLGLSFKKTKNFKGGILSFYATKIITTGYGGAIFLNDKNLYNIIIDLKKYDKRQVYNLSYNYSLSDINAFIGICQIRKLSSILQKRKKIAHIYETKINNQKIKKIFSADDKNNVFFRYPVLVKNKNKFKNYLIKNKIETIDPVYKPLHYYFYKKTLLKNTYYIYNHLVSIPIHLELKNKHIEYIIEKINKYE